MLIYTLCPKNCWVFKLEEGGRYVAKIFYNSVEYAIAD